MLFGSLLKIKKDLLLSCVVEIKKDRAISKRVSENLARVISEGNQVEVEIRRKKIPLGSTVHVIVAALCDQTFLRFSEKFPFYPLNDEIQNSQNVIVKVT